MQQEEAVSHKLEALGVAVQSGTLTMEAYAVDLDAALHRDRRLVDALDALVAQVW